MVSTQVRIQTRINELMNERGLTGADLASLIEIPEEDLHQLIYTESTNIDVENLSIIAHGLDVAVADLLEKNPTFPDFVNLTPFPHLGDLAQRMCLMEFHPKNINLLSKYFTENAYYVSPLYTHLTATGYPEQFTETIPSKLSKADIKPFLQEISHGLMGMHWRDALLLNKQSGESAEYRLRPLVISVLDSHSIVLNTETSSIWGDNLRKTYESTAIWHFEKSLEHWPNKITQYYWTARFARIYARK